MKQRPWIWLIIANVVFITGIITMVVIAVRNKQPDVPVTNGH